MHQYFKPLRRKVGVMTLVLACAFMAVWVRSHLVLDHIEVAHFAGAHHRFAFYSGTFEWESFPGLQGKSSAWFVRPPLPAPPGIQFFKQEETRIVQLHPFAKYPGTIITAKYWLIVVPLTVLSAWLLLSKPKPSHEHQANA